MDIALDEVLHFDAVTHHPSTGAVTDADSTPSWEIFEEDTDTAVQSGNFAKRTSKTGNYRGTNTLSAANGYDVGKWYNVIASATVNSIAGKAVVMRFRVAAAEAVAGFPKIELAKYNGGDVSTNPVPSQLTTRTVSGDSSVVAAAGADGDTLKTLSDQLDTVGGYLDTEVAAILAAVDTEVAAILADTNELQTDWADGGRLDLILDARASQASVNTVDGIVDDILLDTAEIGAAGAGLTEAGGTGDHLTALATQASVNTLAGYVDTEVAAILAAVDTEVAAILADTNELQTDWVNGGRLDLLVDAIKAVTDALGATAAGRLKLSAETMVTGTVDNTGFSPTTTEFEADDITEATADHFNGRIVIFTSGALQYQASDITDYSLASGRGHFTVTALTEAPGNDVTFIIV